MRAIFIFLLICTFFQVFSQGIISSCDEALRLANVNVARYYTLEAEKAFNEDDSRLAYLLAKAALRKDSANTVARQLYDTILPYLSTFLYKESYPFSNSYYRETNWSPDSSAFLFISDKNLQDTTATLNLFSISQSGKLFSFDSLYRNNINYEMNSGFTENGKYLTFFKKNLDNTTGLHFIEVNNPNNVLHLKDVFGGLITNDDKFFAFNKPTGKDRGNLYIAELKTPDKIVASYSNVQDYYYGASKDSHFLYFFTNVKDRVGTLNFFNFEKKKLLFSFTDTYLSYGFTPNSKYFVFFNNVNDTAETRTLNLIEVDKPNKKLSFPNIYNNYPYQEFSSDYKYMVFFTNVKDNVGTLHLLNIQNPKKYQTFADCYIESHAFGFNSDNKYFVFFSKKQGEVGSLHLLNLNNPNQLYSFHQTYVGEYQYSREDDYVYNFSGDNQYFTFYSDVKDNIGTLHLIDIQDTSNHYTYPNIRQQSEKFSTNNNFLAFSSATNQVNLVSLKFPKNPFIYKTRHEYGIDFKFSNNSRYFIFYSNIDSKTKIGTFNLVDLDNPAKKSTYTKMKLKWRIKLF